MDTTPLSIYDQYIDTVANWLYIFAGGLLVLEWPWLLYRRRLNKRRILEMLASFSPFIPAVLAEILTFTALVALYYGVSSLAPWPTPLSGWSAGLALVLVDFTYYWEHRWSHKIRALWALDHSVHHSSPDFNQFTAYRVSFVAQFISPLFYLPLLILGFHPVLVLSGLGFNLAYQTWIHTEMIGKLGWLEKIFNTPSNHRVHHGTEPKYLDKNFGAILIVWDRLFGTYQAEEERPRYGLIPALDSVNPFKVHFYEAGRLLRDLRNARSWNEVPGYLFNRPDWTPQTVKESVVDIKQGGPR